ncbi:S-layer family protein [Streptomyces sp. Rer75]|uniref:beta strand repeat-containing protein n=1 Tax=Streptomyces sp. Rer75 TaxID=2750011 RepID=UPI0015CFE9EF|nr:IPT/TIG domain-containing protein [Streptomyces sp. Rer75]QLH23602.1 IPT/TIG domain-containing protein [Streptomyces sp. Rer75]
MATAAPAVTAASPPVISSVSPASGAPGGGTAVTITGSNFNQATAVRFGTTLAPAFTLVSANQITVTAPAGTGTVLITVTTPGGTSNGVPFSYTSAPVPVLSGVSPGQGPTAGGNTVTLTGSGLGGATAVRFGSVLASFTVVSPSQITAVAPPGSAGPVQVTVTGPGGTSNGVTYTYVASPVLSGVTPNQGPATGGTSVTLTGSGFTGATAVRFGSVLASSFTVVSSTQITAVAPPGSAGPVQVTVTGPGGTSNGVTYTYAAGPVLSGVSPGQGPVSGGTSVTLTGSGFTGATAVKFGSTPAVSFTVGSASQITAVAPPGSAGPVQVTVTGPGGTSNGVTYFYVGIPTLSAVSPHQGPASGGTAVTLTGTNLLGATAVKFGTVDATSFTVVSAIQINAVAPPGSAGTVQVTVITPGGTSNGVPYTYAAVPVLTSAVPGQGPLGGGNTVTLFGTGLTTTSAVRFGSTLAAFTVVSDTWVTATAPAGSAGAVNVTVTTEGGTSNAVSYTRVAGPDI